LPGTVSELKVRDMEKNKEGKFLTTKMHKKRKMITREQERLAKNG
jgi:hypothetical protein